MQFLATLLGDEPALSTDAAYYQRLLAGDRDEATEIVEAHLAPPPTREQLKRLRLFPALTYARRDASELSDPQEQDVLRGTAAILDDGGSDRTGLRSVQPGTGGVCLCAGVPRRQRGRSVVAGWRCYARVLDTLASGSR